MLGIHRRRDRRRLAGPAGPAMPLTLRPAPVLTPPPANGHRPPPPVKHRRLRWLWANNPLLVAVAAIGFSVSFQTITDLAAGHGLPGWPVLYPIGIDVGILALIVESRRAIDDGRWDLVPRAAAWALSLFTIYVNAHGAPAHDWIGRALHIVMPSLWILFLELARWRKVRRARMANGDRIPVIRWFIDWRTAGMWRAMHLANVRSYPEMVARQQVRLAALALMPAVWGEAWEADAPALLRHQLRARLLPGFVAAGCRDARAGDPVGTGELALQWVTEARPEPRRQPAAARRDGGDRRADRRPSPSPTPPSSPPPAPPSPPGDGEDTGGDGSPPDDGKPWPAGEVAARRYQLDHPAATREQAAAGAGVGPRTVDRARKRMRAAGEWAEARQPVAS